ncbi:D-2-hydroxyacid dehydrogenase [Halorubrum sp. DTA98]|uniref:D-2-hydroxyacid dehydrogenase n=1 Tax=Halorubrum sp. DTA98 TaxID=3402163 RepID=UPI003AAA41CC
MDAPDVLLTHLIGTDRAAALAPLLENAIAGEVRVARSPAETDAEIGDARIVVTREFPDRLFERATALEWIHAISAGVDHLDLDRLAEAGVVVTNSSGIHAEPIAEQVLWYLLTFERRLDQAIANAEHDRWRRVEGGELRGKTVGVVGVGAIGTRIAELCSALGTTVLGTKRDLTSMPAVVDEAIPAEEYHELLRRSDYVVLACPLTGETEGLIGDDELRLMGGETVLVNVGRGELCDETALTRALQNDRIRGAGLDTFATEPLPADSPLWNLPSAVLTPHMAGSTPHKPERWCSLIETNYEPFRDGDRENMVNRVV